jgi:Ca2+/H+ antiporter
MNIPIRLKTLFRLLLIAMGAFSFTSLVPAMLGPGEQRLDLVPAILAAVLFGVLIYHAADRRRKLLQTVNLELNKLRRVYHLSRNLSDIDSQRYRSWFTGMHGKLYDYMTAFADKDFSRYEESNHAFRELSYHVYKVPELRSNKEESLYDELLRTIAIVAESRQQIKEANDSRLSSYVWVVVLLVTLCLVATSAMSVMDSVASRAAAGAAITCALLAIDLLWEVDTLGSEQKEISMRYVGNIGRIELRRRGDE